MVPLGDIFGIFVEVTGARPAQAKFLVEVLQTYSTRVGVIIECPLNGLFPDSRDVILTSRTTVGELDDDDDDDDVDDVKECFLPGAHLSLVVIKITTANILSHYFYGYY